MTLLKTSVLTAISTSIRMLASLITNKVIAIFIGPAGLAVIGNFQNFVTALLGFSNGGINNGIVKYSAEYRDDEEQKSRILSTAFLITLCSSLVISIGLIVLHRYLSQWLLMTDKYSDIFMVFGFTIGLFALNTFLLSVLNGHKEIAKYVTVNIVSSIVGLVLTSALVYFRGLYGALLSYTIIQSVVVFVTLGFVVNSRWFRLKNFMRGYDPESLFKLARFSAMMITSSLASPLALMLIRSHIGKTLSWSQAGYWDAMWRISSMYLLVVTTSLSVYYLPRLSEIKESAGLRKEILSGYRLILPIVAAMGLSIFILKDFIISILFTGSFRPMRELFGFQMIGDFFKIASWLLSYIMVAKAMTRTFIATEIIFNASFVGLSMLCLNMFGLPGVTYAYTANYVMYLAAMALVFRNMLKRT